MWGTDQSASLSPEGLKNLTDILSKIPEILGDGKKILVRRKINA